MKREIVLLQQAHVSFVVPHRHARCVAIPHRLSMSSTCCFCRILDLPAALVLHLFEHHGLGARSMLAVGIFRTSLVGRPVKNGHAGMMRTATEMSAAVPGPGLQPGTYRAGAALRPCPAFPWGPPRGTSYLA